MDLTLSLLWAPLLLGLVLATLVGTLAARLGFPLPDERRRLGAIDGLRGYLALLVMVHHFGIWVLMPETGRWEDGPLVLLGNFGAGCVTLFFMITGCLFFPKALAGRATAWGALYISRAFRILPLQAVVVAIVSVIALTRHRSGVDMQLLQYPFRVAAWMSSLRQPALFGYERSALVNALVLWSLKIEWQFYLLGLPAVALLCILMRHHARWIVPAGLIAAGTAIHLLLPGWGPVAVYAVFGCGMLAHAVRGSRIAPALLTRTAALAAGVAVAAAMLWAPHPDDPLPLLAYAGFFLCVACGNRFGGLLATRGALVLGEASFGIYMLHGIVLDLAFHGLWSSIAGWEVRERVWLLPVLMPIAAAVSIALYLAVERPAIAAGRRLAGHGRRSDPAQAGSAITAAP